MALSCWRKINIDGTELLEGNQHWWPPADQWNQCWLLSCSVINVDFTEQLREVNVDGTPATQWNQCWFPSSNSVKSIVDFAGGKSTLMVLSCWREVNVDVTPELRKSMLIPLQQLSEINVDFPPATQLINVELHQHWWYWVAGGTQCNNVDGPSSNSVPSTLIPSSNSVNQCWFTESTQAINIDGPEQLEWSQHWWHWVAGGKSTLMAMSNWVKSTLMVLSCWREVNIDGTELLEGSQHWWHWVAQGNQCWFPPATQLINVDFNIDGTQLPGKSMLIYWATQWINVDSLQQECHQCWFPPATELPWMLKSTLMAIAGVDEVRELNIDVELLQGSQHWFPLSNWSEINIDFP